MRRPRFSLVRSFAGAGARSGAAVPAVPSEEGALFARGGS